MANISDAFGTCRIQSSDPEDIINFVKLQKIIDGEYYYYTSLTPTGEPVLIGDNLYEQSYEVQGIGRWSFTGNMERFFESVFDDEYIVSNNNLLRDKLKQKQFKAIFNIIDSECGYSFIVEGEYHVYWEDGESEFETVEESEHDYTAENLRYYGVQSDAVDTTYILQNFDAYIDIIKELIKEDGNDESTELLHDDDKLKEVIRESNLGVYNDIYEFVEYLIDEYLN